MRYVIVGNGAAGISAAETIRQHDQTGEVVIIGAEPYPMYSRPGLAYVALNEVPWKQVITRQPEWYAQNRFKLVTGRAIRLDTGRQRVLLKDGRKVPYDRLLIATGARASTPPYPGADLKGVVYLDTLDGTRALKRLAKRGRRAVVIGGGITALEMTEALANNHLDTHYFLRKDRLWGKVFNDIEASLLEERIKAHGVHIHYFAEIAEILGRRGKVRGVRLKSSDELDCDVVGVAIGVKAQLDLIQGTTIESDRAILVDEYMQSTKSNVFAAGDCAQVYDRWTRQYMLDVLWHSAVAEGKTAGLNMVGRRQPYVKGTPFNACLLFGLHVSIIGQINPRPDEEGVDVFQHITRGSSEIWFTYPRHYHSAWSREGANTLRLVLDGEYLVGALVVGDQSLADPLRYIIENHISVRSFLPQLKAGGDLLRQVLERFWYRQNLSRVGAENGSGGER